MEAISQERLAEMEGRARLLGSYNGLTSTIGTLAGMIIELLKEVERLKDEQRGE